MRLSYVNTLLTLATLHVCFSFRNVFLHSTLRATHMRIDDANEESGFDGAKFENALKAVQPWTAGINMKQENTAEVVSRKYEFADYGLPVLNDCNNYYSGKFGEEGLQSFWHQNADQVFAFILLNASTSRSDISVKFEAARVTVRIEGDNAAPLVLDCGERIIPDGSFWTVEDSAVTGKRYLHLDLEKRFRMINWKNLFGPSTIQDLDAKSSRAAMMDKLFAANKGMAKLTGTDPQTMEQMLQDDRYLSMAGRDVDTTPRVVGAEDFSGRKLSESELNMNKEVEELRAAIARGEIDGIQSFDFGSASTSSSVDDGDSAINSTGSDGVIDVDYVDSEASE